MTTKNKLPLLTRLLLVTHQSVPLLSREETAAEAIAEIERLKSALTQVGCILVGLVDGPYGDRHLEKSRRMLEIVNEAIRAGGVENQPGGE